jgi:glycosyltransferase involved in cell wall biosynthesis
MTDAPIRLAILGTRGIPAQYGGFETFAQELSTRLAAKGVEVTVYCIASKTKQPSTYSKVLLSYVPSPRLGPITTVAFDMLCLWRARKSYDVVYMLGYGAAFFCFIPRLWGSKVWINVDGIEWARAKWNFIAKSYFKFMEAVAVRVANRIIADAEGIKDFLLERHKTITTCTVIPYGAPLVNLKKNQAQLAQWSIQAGQYYLVVSRLEPENHVLEILQGYAVSMSSCPLLVVGDYHRQTDYVKSLQGVKDDRIRFLGAVYDHDKLQALRYCCKAYFHGHSVGGTNPSLLEALGCGNVIVAHDNVFNREVAGDAGLYFKNGNDIPGLINKIETMDNEMREKLLSIAVNRIREQYTWEIVTDKYMGILSSRENKRKDAVSH